MELLIDGIESAKSRPFRAVIRRSTAPPKRLLADGFAGPSVRAVDPKSVQQPRFTRSSVCRASLCTTLPGPWRPVEPGWRRFGTTTEDIALVLLGVLGLDDQVELDAA